MSTYSRLKNLVKDELAPRQLLWNAEADKSRPTASFEPEHMQRVTKFDFETGERANTWVEDTLRFILDRKRMERNDPQKETLHLFRLMAVLFRLEHPVTGARFELKPQVLMALESKICTSLLSLFDNPTGATRADNSKSRSKSKQTKPQRRPAQNS